MITGAGISTASGIPDYRSPNGAYSKGHKPIVHDEFMKSEYKRQRYWGRGMVGYKHFSKAEPNAGHVALASMERKGKIGVGLDSGSELSIITQNVDALHEKANSSAVIELHGRGDR